MLKFLFILYNFIYLFSQLEDVIVRFTDDPDAPEKVKECCPGAPFVIFSVKEGVKIEFVNPIPQNGLFSKIITISDGDSYAQVAQRIAKDTKLIKSKLANILNWI